MSLFNIYYIFTYLISLVGDAGGFLQRGQLHDVMWGSPCHSSGGTSLDGEHGELFSFNSSGMLRLIRKGNNDPAFLSEREPRHPGGRGTGRQDIGWLGDRKEGIKQGLVSYDDGSPLSSQL